MRQTIVGFKDMHDFNKVVDWAREAGQSIGTNRIPRGTTPYANELLIYLSKTDWGSTFTKGSAHDMNIYCSRPTPDAGSQGSETSQGARPDGVMSSVFNRLGDIASGKWCYVLEINGLLEVWNAEC